MTNLPTNVICLGPIQSSVYYINNGNLYVHSFNGTVLHSYTVGVSIGSLSGISSLTPITCYVDYDGAVFFTVEYKNDNVIFRRWEIDFNQHSLVLIKTITYLKHGTYYFDYAGFSVQRYDRLITSPLAIGSYRVYLNSTSLLEVGLECVIGPSTAGSSIGRFVFAKITGVHTTYVDIDKPVDYDFKAGDPVTVMGDLIFASYRGVSGSSIPVLYYLDSSSFAIKRYSSLYQIAAVKGIFFINNLLYMASKYNFYTYRCDINALNSILYSYQKCVDYMDVYGIIALTGNEFFTIQIKGVSFSNFLCNVADFNNYGLVNNITDVYPNTVSIAVDEYSNITDSDGVVYVLDQYGRGLYGQHVYVESDDGGSSISSTNWYTDIYGKVEFTYSYGDNTTQTLKAYVNSTYSSRSSDYVFGYCTTYKKQITYYTTSSVRLNGLDNIECNVNVYKVKLEYEVICDVVKKGIKHTTLISTFTSPIAGEYYIGVYGLTKTTHSVLDNIVGINTLGGSSLSTYITAYTNGPISVNTTVSTFIFISYFKPIPFSHNNPRNSIIDFFIYPSSYPLDIPTFTFNINEVNNELGINSGWCNITEQGSITLIDVGGRYAIKFTYDNPELYHYDSTIYCRIEVYDTAAIPNRYFYQCYFSTVADYNAPITVSVSPECYDKDVPIDADICVVINDDGAGVKNDSIKLYVDGVPVYYTVYNVSGGTAILYKNTPKFFPGAIVTYSWKASDNLGNTLYDSCLFTVEESKGPDINVEPICGDIVDNRFSFYFDIYDAGSGIKEDSIELILHNKLAPFIGKEILYRIK